jgi:H+/Cl- antiporter ClcA
VGILVVAAILGVPISALAYGFLQLTTHMPTWVYGDLPKALGFRNQPVWWPVPALLLAGILVGLTIRYLPGRGGHSPADGFKTHSPAPGRYLPGITLAALATLCLGAVLGPEAPLIALGSGVAAWSVRTATRHKAPENALAVLGAAGSFAAVSTLLGSPLTGALLLLEASGLGGATASVVLVPGLLAAGVGALIFVGLDSLSGLPSTSLAIPNLPHFARPDIAEFGWALVIGLAAALLGPSIRRLALMVRPHVERRLVLLTPLIGLAVAGLAITYVEATGKSSLDVLYSGQTSVGPFLSNSSSYTVNTLLLLLACKGIAYSLSLSAFRGGPIFPAIFLGAAGGVAMSHLPGLPMVPAIGMGIGAMTVAMLNLPITSVLLATLLLASDGVAIMPLVIVAVVVAYVATAWITGRHGGTRPESEVSPRGAVASNVET